MIIEQNTMTNELTQHLGKDTLPEELLREFVDWCVWQQSRPALKTILKKTGMLSHAENVTNASNLAELASACQSAGKHANEARKNTGPLGLSTAEATAFLAQKMAHSAMTEPIDVEEIAFFTVQLVGWQGFALADFLNPMAKPEYEDRAKEAQEAKLQELWKKHQPDSNADATDDVQNTD